VIGIDIATSMLRYSDEPYILASNAEPVFYVPWLKNF